MKHQPQPRHEFRFSEQDAKKMLYLVEVVGLPRAVVCQRFQTSHCTLRRMLKRAKVSDALQRREKGSGQAEKPPLLKSC